MFSFQVPTNICRELLHKFLKTSSLARQFILPEMADQILMLLENEEEKLPEELLYLVDLAYEYLTKNGFSVCKTRGTIDFWNYQINNDPVINSLLDEHNDNYYLDDYNVHTCIFYTQKDETFNGGNLYYFIDSENAFFDILGIDQKKYLLPIESKMVVLMDGDLVHQPESYSGTGVRNSIVVSLMSL